MLVLVGVLSTCHVYTLIHVREQMVNSKHNHDLTKVRVSLSTCHFKSLQTHNKYQLIHSYSVLKCHLPLLCRQPLSTFLDKEN